MSDGNLAILYARVSSDAQADADKTSLDTQLAACREYANQHGLVVLREVREVWSGEDFYYRPELDAAREDLRAGRGHHLIAYTTDRLSRSEPLHLLLLLEEAEKAGAQLHFVLDPLESTPEGKLILYIKGFVAQAENAKRRERTWRGMRAKASAGKLLGIGSGLYGYDADTAHDPVKQKLKKTGTRSIRPEQAAVVRDIFAWIANGEYSIKAVIDKLNAEGVPAPSSGKYAHRPGVTPRWGHGAIARLVTEPAYMGETYAFRYRQAPKQAGQRHPNVEVRPRDEWVLLPEGTTPAIVSAELWQRANRVLSHNQGERTRNMQAARFYLLRGRVTCGQCGRPMYSNPEHNVRVYRCSSRTGRNGGSGPCGGSRVPAAELERAVWLEVEAALLDPQRLVALADQQHEDGGLDAERTTLRQRADKLAVEQQRLVNRLSADADERLWQLVQDKVAALETERLSVLARLADLDRRRQAAQVQEQQKSALWRVCAEIVERLNVVTDVERREVLAELDVQVTANGRDWSLHSQVALPDLVADEPAKRRGMSRGRPPGGVPATIGSDCGNVAPGPDVVAWAANGRLDRAA